MCRYIPVLTLQREDVRNKKLLGLGAELVGEPGFTQDASLICNKQVSSNTSSTLIKTGFPPIQFQQNELILIKQNSNQYIVSTYKLYYIALKKIKANIQQQQ